MIDDYEHDEQPDEQPVVVQSLFFDPSGKLWWNVGVDVSKLVFEWRICFRKRVANGIKT